MYATPAQIGFIQSLVASRVCSQSMLDRAVRVETLTKSEASALITDLKAAPFARPAAPREVPEGMHKIGTKIFRVQKSRESGRRYAKELVTRVTGTCGGCEHCDGEDACKRVEASFVYSAGAMRLLSEDTRMTLTEAEAWGLHYGVCCVCARTLTDPVSVARGLGPVCAGRI